MKKEIKDFNEITIIYTTNKDKIQKFREKYVSNNKEKAIFYIMMILIMEKLLLLII